MNELKKQIKEKNLKNLYLFYGEEGYLKKHYTNEIVNCVLPEAAKTMNLDIFDEKSYGADKLAEKCETMAFMADCRVVVVKDSGIFAPGKKDEAEKTFEYLPNLPSGCIVIFVEEKIDKRSKLFKKVSQIGKAVEFKIPGESVLLDWVVRKAKGYGSAISKGNASFLVNTLKSGMEALDIEISKLSDYAKDREITRNDIELTVTKPLESKVFDMIKAVSQKKTEEALYMYNSMLLLKEQPIGILTLMSRQFKNMLMVKELAEQRKSASEISGQINLHIFAVKNCIDECKMFSFEKLEQAYIDCLETDVNIKTGKITDRLAVELLIVKYGS